MHGKYKLILALIFILFSSKAWAYPSYLAVTCASATSDGNITTGSINTTGANLIVLVVAYFTTGGANGTPTDSLSNTWNALTNYNAQANGVQMFYSYNPITGGSQTFTENSNSNFPAICAIAFKNSETFDGQQNGLSQVSGSTIQPGSITPQYSNEVVVSGVSFGSAATVSVSSPFAIPTGGQANFSSSNGEGVGVAYYFQGSSAAVNPTWTVPNTTGASDQAAFTPDDIRINNAKINNARLGY